MIDVRVTAASFLHKLIFNYSIIVVLILVYGLFSCIIKVVHASSHNKCHLSLSIGDVDWYKDGVNISRGDEYRKEIVSAEDRGIYTARIEHQAGTVELMYEFRVRCKQQDCIVVFVAFRYRTVCLFSWGVCVIIMTKCVIKERLSL